MKNSLLGPMIIKTLNSLALSHFELFEDNGYDKAAEMFESNPFYLNIKKYLKKYLSVEFKLFRVRGTHNSQYQTIITDSTGVTLNINEVSSGQLSILSFIFSVFSEDLQDGFVLLDEPELHLHPQMQLSFAELIQEARRVNNTQVVYVTHSPYFISHETVHSVNRFIMGSNGTDVFSPQSISSSDKELFRILTATNTSKIFFAEKVILVDGDTDEYFFKGYLKLMIDACWEDGP